jgi:hypothetical protein
MQCYPRRHDSAAAPLQGPEILHLDFCIDILSYIFNVSHTCCCRPLPFFKQCAGSSGIWFIAEILCASKPLPHRVICLVQALLFLRCRAHLLLQQHYTLNLCPAVSTVIRSHSVAVLASFFTWKTGKYPVKENRTPFTCTVSQNVETWHTVTKNAVYCKLWQSAAGKVLGVLLHMAACLGRSLTFLHLPLFAPTNYLLNQGASYWW